MERRIKKLLPKNGASRRRKGGGHESRARVPPQGRCPPPALTEKNRGDGLPVLFATRPACRPRWPRGAPTRVGRDHPGNAASGSAFSASSAAFQAVARTPSLRGTP